MARALFVAGAVAAYRTGPTKIRRREPWVVAERFCFEGTASFDYDVKTRGATALYVYGHRDPQEFLEDVDKKEMSLQQRFERADTEVRLLQGETTGSLKLKADHPTFVHVVFTNFNASCNAVCEDVFACDAEVNRRCYGPVDAKYEFSFLDGAKEHGRDQRGAPSLYGVLAAIYVLFVGLAGAVEGVLIREDKRHVTCTLLFRSVWVSALAVWLRMLHHAVYTNDGRGAPKLLKAAQSLELVADAGVLLTLALCAEGWRIVRRKIAITGRTRVAVLVVTYVLGAACAYAWYLSANDRATSPALRETPSGYALVVLRVVAGGIVALRLRQQQDRFLTSNRDFYGALYFLLGAWTSTWPLAFGAAAIAKPADRCLAFDGVLGMASLLIQIGLVYCFKPGTLCFPFHANVVNASSAARTPWSSRTSSGSSDPRFAGLSGGRGANTNSAKQYVIDDGFEALHVRRLKHVWKNVSGRLDAVEDSARALAAAVALVDTGDARRAQPDATPRGTPPRTPPRNDSPRRPGDPDTPSSSARRKTVELPALPGSTARRAGADAPARKPRERSPPRNPPPEDDAYSGAPVPTEGADPRDDLRGEADVDSAAPP